MPDDKVVRFPGWEENKVFPPNSRIKEIIFYGSAIVLPGGRHVSPHASHVFDVPASEEQACAVIQKFVDRGGIMGWIDQEYYFIPWPFAAVHFEMVDVLV